MQTNYTNYSRHNKFEKPKLAVDPEPVVETEAIVEQAPEVTEIPEVVEEPKPVVGKVVDCEKLNVRNVPDKDSIVLCTIDRDTEVTIDEKASTEEFYKICLAVGIEGFCMRKFIAI